MKSKFAITAIALIFVVGICIMAYPLFSAVINNISSRNNVASYQKSVEGKSENKINAMFKEADVYNKSLTNNVILTDPFDANAYKKIGANYEKTFNTESNGLIGYIDIPKINVYLPIFHGTSESVLAKGAGHMANTSLPVGGKSTHSVISAHTGFPTETFFDYLTDIKINDVFYVHVLNKTLKYQVDQIKVVLPEKISDLRIIKDCDYVTLLTCTPYSINTHRLLVRGKRVPYNDSNAADKNTIKNFSLQDGCLYFLGYKIPYWVAGIVVVGFVGLVVLLIFLIVKKGKKKERHFANSKKIADNKNVTDNFDSNEDGV